MVKFPPDFSERMQHRLGVEWLTFCHAFNQLLPTSIRIHPIKKVYDLFPDIMDENVKWCQWGYYLTDRPHFTLDPLFHAGSYYVQDASSMFIDRTFPKNDQPMLVLDLCASPGGKSTLLASLMNENSILIANEVIKNRLAILKENLIKWGYPNVIITSLDVEELVKTGLKFDYVLVDAPCSGEGLWRKSPKAIDEWSLENVRFCAERQKRILAYAKQLVNAGGRLVYSTCTFSPEENEDQLAYLAEDEAFHSLPISLENEWGIEEIIHIGNYGYVFYPHRVKGEGFFCSVWENTRSSDVFDASYIHKRNGKSEAKLKSLLQYLNDGEFVLEESNEIIRAYPFETYHLLRTIEHKLTKFRGGITLGSMKGQVFIPSHDLALSLKRSHLISSIELSKEQALRYLKRELTDIENIDNGWHLISYKGLGLGWVKKISGRINNYLPTQYRIRMDIDYQEL
jgi:16S rRNA C967 or C1407 C5-methylase (RsmB/RsmF family)/NOL1/NOP2/fmu family ribosome biogenesis protein